MKILFLSFTCEDTEIYLKLNLLCDRNIIGSNLDIFGNLRTFVSPSDSSINFWKIFGYLRKVFGNLRKIVKKVVVSMFMLNSISHSCDIELNSYTRNPLIFRQCEGTAAAVLTLVLILSAGYDQAFQCTMEYRRRIRLP